MRIANRRDELRQLRPPRHRRFAGHSGRGRRRRLLAGWPCARPLAPWRNSQHSRPGRSRARRRLRGQTGRGENRGESGRALGWLALQCDRWLGRHRAPDGGRMGLWAGHAALVPLAGVRAGASGADSLRRALLPGRLATTQGGRVQYGHPGLPRIYRRLRLQRLGALFRRGRTSVFHGVVRDHHAHQRGPLDGGPRHQSRGEIIARLVPTGPAVRRPTQPRRNGIASARRGPSTWRQRNPATRRPRSNRRPLD